MKSGRTVSDYLRDIIEYAAIADELIVGMDFDGFNSDRRTHMAVIRAIEVIGEAARYVPESLRRAYPAVPWTRIVGTRNIVAHGYFGVDLKVVWDSVLEDLPPLRDAVARMLDDIEAG